MGPRGYLPSAQFMVIVGSLLAATGAVAAAQYYVASQNAPAALTSAGTKALDGDWQESLADIQAESGIGLPDAPDPNAVANLIAQAQSNNLTDSIGRSILARISTANVQGLGSDAPTQDTILAAATAQVNASAKVVQAPPLTIIETTLENQRVFGNEVMAAMGRHPKASTNATLEIIAKATDTRIAGPLSGLPSIGEAYAALAQDLAGVPVPKTLAPLYKQAVTNLTIIGSLYGDLGLVVSDPIKGLAALQQYQELMAETGEVLTNIAGALKNGGILFTKDEPGSAWEIFLSAS